MPHVSALENMIAGCTDKDRARQLEQVVGHTHHSCKYDSKESCADARRTLYMHEGRVWLLRGNLAVLRDVLSSQYVVHD